DRKLFINGDFYPLVFEADKLFGCIESPRDILTSFLRSDSIAGSREFTIYDGFHITFKKDGTLVDSGSFHIYDKAPDKIISIKRQNELK
ncbi:MAG: hypothetical protein J7497_09525, partial [Chitinophagaceae bacterium]|nr:hypothetical protein [Chitinophagaceae bacterium]